MKPIIVSYHTDAFHSKECADNLRQTAEKFGYQTDIVKLHTLGSLRKDMLYKSSFCYSMLDKYRVPILYLDADSIVLAEEDFSAFRSDDIVITDKYPTSFIYMHPSFDSFEILESWANATCRIKDKDVFDGDIFTTAIRFCNKTISARIAKTDPAIGLPGTVYEGGRAYDDAVSSSMEPIDFFVTAISRDKIFKESLESICCKMHGVDFGKCNLRIFLDTAYGDDLKESVSFASSKFANVFVEKNLFKNYASNLAKCLGSVDSDLFFYFQDDYRFVQEFDFAGLVNAILINKNKSQIALKNTDERNTVLCVRPSLLTREFGHCVSKALTGKDNPNKVLQNRQEEIRVFDNSVSQYPIGKHGRLLEETGTEFMLKNGYTRNDIHNFLYWEKK